MVSLSVQKLKKFFTSHWLLILLFFTFLLRLPSLFEPFTYGDEGIYLTLGQAIRKGLVLYRDIHDNKPPMIYLMAALTGNFSLYRIYYFCWSFITLLVFWQLAKLLLDKNKKGIILSTALFAVLTSLPFLEGNIANAENFMILPIMAGFYLVIEHLNFLNKKNGLIYFWWFLSGILFSLATLFKIPALFDFAAAFLLIMFFIERKNYRNLISFLLINLSGFLLPIIISFVYFYLKGSLGQYFTAAFAQNLPYLSSWSDKTKSSGGLPVLLLTRAGIVFLITTLFFCFRKKISFPVKILTIWFIFSLFAALLSSRPYPHYLIQVLPSFCLSFGLLLGKKKQFKAKIIPIIFSAILIFSFISFNFWYYPSWPYYKNFYQYALRLKTKDNYLNYFSPQAQTIYETANFIKNHTAIQQKIFIWGNQPSIYALANRLPVGRYTVSYHIIDFNAYQETMKNLLTSPPRWIIVTQDEQKSFPELEDLIGTNYSLFQQFGQFKIFYQLPKTVRL